MSLPVAIPVVALRAERLELSSPDPAAANSLDESLLVTLSPLRVLSIPGSSFTVQIDAWSTLVLRLFFNATATSGQAEQRALVGMQG